MKHVDDVIWELVEKDVLKHGFEYRDRNIQLKLDELKRSRARGGFTIGQLVHQATLNEWTALTFDDISGAPYRALASRRDADLTTSLAKGLKLSMPLISANMESVTGKDMAIAMAQMGGLGILHQFNTPEEQARLVKQVKEAKVETLEIDKRTFAPSVKRRKYLVGAAIGVKKENMDRTEKLVNAGVDVIAVDIAHGHSDQTVQTIKKLKRKYKNIPVIAGNVVTPKGAYDLCKAGVDVLKVGVGPGAACTTRIVTGYGIPQVTAIYQTRLIADKFNVKIMADGGIRNSGDMVKALAAGADTIMLGSILAATDKSNHFEERIAKFDKNKLPAAILYYGSASALSKEKQHRASWDAPEGRSVFLAYRGRTTHVLAKLVTGMESGISYAGSSRDPGKTAEANIERLRTKSRWVKQTTSGILEGSKGNADSDRSLT